MDGRHVESEPAVENRKSNLWLRKKNEDRKGHFKTLALSGQCKKVSYNIFTNFRELIDGQEWIRILLHRSLLFLHFLVICSKVKRQNK